jgi:predicted flap endonuclease-1-like 5' DNA nuclease
MLLRGAGLVVLIRLIPVLFSLIFRVFKLFFSILTTLLGIAARFAIPVAAFFLFRWLLLPRDTDGKSLMRNNLRSIQAARGYAAIFDVPTLTKKPKGSAADDFKVIEGIGPAISRLLAENGVQTFKDLSRSSPQTLRQILEKVGLGNIANPETWPDQARLAAAGDWEGLRVFQGHLKAGRST